MTKEWAGRLSPSGSCSLFGVGVSGTRQGEERGGRWVSGTLSGTWARPAREAVSISVATSLIFVLAWGPALHTLPSPAGVGFLAGNHGNAFVSEAWPCLPPGFSLQQRLRELLLSRCTSQAPADSGPPPVSWASPGVGDDSLSGPSKAAWAPPLPQRPLPLTTPCCLQGHRCLQPDLKAPCPAGDNPRVSPSLLEMGKLVLRRECRGPAGLGGGERDLRSVL